MEHFMVGVGTPIRQERIQARRVAGIIFASGRSCFPHWFCICLVEVSGFSTINHKPRYQRCQGQRLASSFYRWGAQHPERLIHLPKITQPADVKMQDLDLCLRPSVITAYSSLDCYSLKLWEGKGEKPRELLSNCNINTNISVKNGNND